MNVSKISFTGKYSAGVCEVEPIDFNRHPATFTVWVQGRGIKHNWNVVPSIEEGPSVLMGGKNIKGKYTVQEFPLTEDACKNTVEFNKAVASFFAQENY